MITQKLNTCRRVFLVGCSRSGTTLLKVLISSHPKIYSPSMTAFFIKTMGQGRWNAPSPRSYLGLTNGKAHSAITTMLQEANREDLLNQVPKRLLLCYRAVNCYTQLLDQITHDVGKEIWLEKTPLHLFYIHFIKKYIPDAHIIFIVRDGRDVVASIYERALKFPDMFGHQRDLSYSIKLWNKSMDTYLKWINQPGHIFVLYDQLIEQPEAVVEQIYANLGIDNYEFTEQDLKKTYERVIPPDKGWVKVANQYPRKFESKFTKLFDNKIQESIKLSLKLDKLQQLKATIKFS